MSYELGADLNRLRLLGAEFAERGAQELEKKSELLLETKDKFQAIESAIYLLQKASEWRSYVRASEQMACAAARLEPVAAAEVKP